jgi:hypothetical protein
MLKMKVALFRKAQDVETVSLYAAKSDYYILCFTSIFKIEQSELYVAIT